MDRLGPHMNAHGSHMGHMQAGNLSKSFFELGAQWVQNKKKLSCVYLDYQIPNNYLKGYIKPTCGPSYRFLKLKVPRDY